MSDTKPPLNQGQQAAAQGFLDFLFDKQPEMIISGPGGVGKTFLMGHMIDEIMPQYQNMCSMMGIPTIYNEVEMTATTNKAAEVLGGATNRPSSTIQSFLRLKVADDYTTGQSSLVRNRDWRVQQNKIIFVDEAYTIDRNLLEEIRSSTANCKIVYVGDHCQLAPVKESISPIHNQRLPIFHLTEPMRTDNPDLQAINAQLRETVETGIFKPIRIVPGVIDWLDGKAMQDEVDAHFQNQNSNSRILAYHNDRVVQFNDYIRSMRGLTTTYAMGENLINNAAVQLSDRMLSVEQEVKIVGLSDTTELMTVEDGVEMEIRYADLKTKFDVITEVALPEDKNHFNELLKYYRSRKLWTKYYFLKNKFPDLRPRESATVHKAQGSTYDTVFIDLDNLSKCHNPNTAARLLYVAFSRARTRVVLYGDLVAKYGGLIR